MLRPKLRGANASLGSAAIEMRPVAKIALGGALGGLMLTVAVVAELRNPQPQVLPPTNVNDAEAARAVIPARCKTITMPDSGCDAAWEASRRHFFREEGR
jgi:conjugative transfer region protein TrbK